VPVDRLPADGIPSVRGTAEPQKSLAGTTGVGVGVIDGVGVTVLTTVVGVAPAPAPSEQAVRR
jgi:hypothetical protein